jgi:hypothetical protein
MMLEMKLLRMLVVLQWMLVVLQLMLVVLVVVVLCVRMKAHMMIILVSAP